MKGVRIIFIVMVVLSLTAIIPVIADEENLPDGCRIVIIDECPVIICDEIDLYGIGCPLDDCWGN